MKFLKIAAIFAALLLALSACTEKKADIIDTTIDFPDEYASSEYIEALANESYILDVSLFHDDMLIYNTVAQSGGVIESYSSINGSTSHTLSRGGETYFIDDENRVYFLADTSDDGGLQGGVDYSAAKYIGSGRETLMTGKECDYDEYLCKTGDGEECGVKLYLNDKGELSAIVDYYGDQSIERDVSYFSTDIPEGWLEIPADYTLVDEDTYFNEYYGR
ncbi:MAG: hypothetical protein IKV98_10275 [Clostridia bacterium]|nr:hypothetical protein [Clostridia bacterium]